jgi:hypothetical protein
MFTETEASTAAGETTTSWESGGSAMYVPWREHPGQRPGLLYLLRLREHRRRRRQESRKRIGKLGFVTQL